MHTILLAVGLAVNDVAQCSALCMHGSCSRGEVLQVICSMSGYPSVEAADKFCSFVVASSCTGSNIATSDHQ